MHIVLACINHAMRAFSNICMVKFHIKQHSTNSRKLTWPVLVWYISLCVTCRSIPKHVVHVSGRQYMAGGNLGTALQRDMMQSERSGKRRLGWYGRGCNILVGVARGLAYLHEQRVRAG